MNDQNNLSESGGDRQKSFDVYGDMDAAQLREAAQHARNRAREHVREIARLYANIDACMELSDRLIDRAAQLETNIPPAEQEQTT